MAISFVGQVPEDERDDWIKRLSDLLPGETIRAFEDLSEADKHEIEIAVVANPEPAKLEALPNLKWIHSVWAGVERMMAELSHLDVPIVRLVDPELSRVMGEAVLAWTYYLQRDMPKYRDGQKNKAWIQHAYKYPWEVNVTLLGLGALGMEAARRLKEAGFQVNGWSRNLKEIDGISCHCGTDGLTEVLGKTDILVSLLPLTAQTRGLLSKERLSQLKSGANLINFARGPIIVDEDLIMLLDTGHIAHAVLDVFAVEPLPETDPYWSHPSVTVLPHISAPSDINSASSIVADNIASYRKTGEVPGAVDRSSGY
ncbi:glyoxylate/hydroxypyruvate reductase A [Sneathiella sp. P13V-1]|uniref:2-hydroxyacid dehydrogenase n=1 Tax=Sneathiella sp. P13V-1 TaxID=2697366 RepID=UPI00187B28AE|nr:glyoxylate/hydroxypyruvate reductase A [Sneathiella sp. P13V-1]MBE7637798.1 glyoxylate/hydroxypyruvate reductase A [Sneathiella sp. P13V-1]